MGIIFKNYAQNINYSQFLASGVHISPTFVAHKNRHSAGVINRNQWYNLNSKFSFTQVDANFAINSPDRHLGGLGIQFENDLTGAGLTKQAIYLNAAVNVPLDKMNNLYFGIKAGGVFYAVNTEDISTGGDYVPGVGDGNTGQYDFQDQKNGLDLGFGLSYQFNIDKTTDAPVYILAGASLLHFYNPYSGEEGNSLFDSQVYFANLMFLATENIEVGPVFLYDNYIPGVSYAQYGLAGTYKFNNDSDGNFIIPSFVSLYAYYNSSKSAIPELRLGNRYYNLGLSTDLYFNELQSYRTYEISLRISFGKLKSGGNKPVNTTPRYQYSN